MCLEWCMNCTRFGMHSPPSPSSLYSATWGCYQTNKAELEQRDRANDMVMSKCRWYATFESPVNFVLRFRSCRVRLDFFLVTFFFPPSRRNTHTTESNCEKGMLDVKLLILAMCNGPLIKNRLAVEAGVVQMCENKWPRSIIFIVPATTALEVVFLWV